MDKKRIFIVSIAVLWVAVVVGMIWSKEFTLRTGTRVLLETVPVDPRDLLRGDYVVLNYAISTIDLKDISCSEGEYQPGAVLYVELKQKGKYWEAAYVTCDPDEAAEGIYIRGRVDHRYGKKLTVKYGIESYFVSEGTGKEIEDKINRGPKSQVAVDVSIGRNGEAVINRLVF